MSSNSRDDKQAKGSARRQVRGVSHDWQRTVCQVLALFRPRVKLGKSLSTKEWCAIKIMKGESSQINSFMEEVRIMAQCKHSNVLGIIAASSTGCLMPKAKKGISYIIMSYAKFGELFKIIQDTGPLNETLARSYFLQLLKGIEYLHSMSICHRDIKLENLLIDKDLNLIIADFGSASKLRTDAGKSLPFDASLPVGSREYNPPELHTEKLYYGERADIFAAGVCLFLMLLGHPPFREASLRDPYFKKLARKNGYWDVYKAINVPVLFKDLFERIAEIDSSKRIELREIYTHPWMAGPVCTAEELKNAMHDRMQLYLKKCWRHTRAATKSKKLELTEREELSKEKTPNKNECAEVRRRLEFEEGGKLGNDLKKGGDM
eukprot:TRINITY_DN11471_c0_g2_i1.p1 TRINITY_DN11471_c0_g2~~TRINITY_DN11471_c0_g2_i1.p1  ORF type:complete len:377 (-),score=74.05 TRINITY_DN11471_c0_g2_i1:75-1205(-)